MPKHHRFFISSLDIPIMSRFFETTHQNATPTPAWAPMHEDLERQFQQQIVELQRRLQRIGVQSAAVQRNEQKRADCQERRARTVCLIIGLVIVSVLVFWAFDTFAFENPVNNYVRSAIHPWNLGAGFVAGAIVTLLTVAILKFVLLNWMKAVKLGILGAIVVFILATMGVI